MLQSWSLKYKIQSFKATTPDEEAAEDTPHEETMSLLANAEGNFLYFQLFNA